MNRAAGILLSITSLPSKYGIGCFSKSAYDFVDWLKKAGQTYWQILPLVPTSYGDSPYQSFSTFAGNPYFISLEALIEEGVLTQQECDEADFGNNEKEIDYQERKTAVDLLVSHFAYIFDFNDKRALQIVKENDYFEKLYKRFQFQDTKTRERMEKIYQIVKENLENIEGENR